MLRDGRFSRIFGRGSGPCPRDLRVARGDAVHTNGVGWPTIPRRFSQPSCAKCERDYEVVCGVQRARRELLLKRLAKLIYYNA